MMRVLLWLPSIRVQEGADLGSCPTCPELHCGVHAGRQETIAVHGFNPKVFWLQGLVCMRS